MDSIDRIRILKTDMFGKKRYCISMMSDRQRFYALDSFGDLLNHLKELRELSEYNVKEIEISNPRREKQVGKEKYFDIEKEKLKILEDNGFVLKIIE